MPSPSRMRRIVNYRAPVAASAVPTNPDTAGLVLQMLGSAGVATSGSSVTSWTDQSALATVFSQATGGLQPQYIASGINGLPIIRFSGSTYLVASGVITGLDIALLKCFAVVKVTGGTSTARAIYSNYNSTGNLGWEVLADANDNWRLAYGSGTGLSVSAGGTVDSTAHVITSVFQTGGTNELIRVDGTQVVSDGTAMVSQTTLASCIGCNSTTQGTEKFIGDIAELLIYNTAIHDPTLGTIEAYLKSKYNTP